MADQTLTLQPKFALNPRSYRWSSQWIPGKPHFWIAQKRYRSGVVVFEVEAGNSSLTHNVPAYPQFDCALEVAPPAGYEIVGDCNDAQGRPRAWPDTWPPMHCAFRRYAIWPQNRPDLQGQAAILAAGELRSDWALRRATYGPCNLPLPTLAPDIAASAAATASAYLQVLRQALVSGQPMSIEDTEDGPVLPPWRGWRVWGPAAHYAPGGSGIQFSTGCEQSKASVPFLNLAAQCAHERRWHAYDRVTGEPVSADWYGDPGPLYQQATGDPNNGWLPEFSGVATDPDPIALPFDAAHSIRGFRHALALSELSDSPIAARSIASQAAQFRLQYSERGPYPQSGYYPPSLRQWLAEARLSPQEGRFGYDLGRITGWPAYLIAQSIKLGRKENLPWARMMVRLADTVAMPSGITQRVASSDPDDVWGDADHDTAQAFEVAIFWAGVSGCARQLGVPIPRAMLKAVQSLYETAPLWDYYSSEKGPPHFCYVARRGGQPYQTVTDGKASNSPPGDATHTMAFLALAASADPSMRWINGSARIGQQHATWQQKAQVMAQNPDLRYDALMLAQYQSRLP